MTGATGFIGRHLVRELVRRGHRVHVLVRPRDSWPSEVEGAEVHLYRTSEDVRIAVQKAQPDVVYHLASLFLAENTFEQVAPLVEGNLLLGTELVDAMMRSDRKKLVTAGTAWQNFGRKGTASCLYAATKEAYESILRYYVDAEKLEACVLKLYDTYGPGDERRKLLKLIRESAARGEEMGLSPGEQKIDLLHVSDVVRAFLVAGERMMSTNGARFEEYYLRSGQLLSVKELVETFNRAADKPLKARFGARPYRAREVMVPWQEGEILPGWKPQISLEAGLKEFAAEKIDV